MPHYVASDHGLHGSPIEHSIKIRFKFKSITKHLDIGNTLVKNDLIDYYLTCWSFVTVTNNVSECFPFITILNANYQKSN